MDYKETAERIWPEAIWVMSYGRFAVVSHCNALTVDLYETYKKALKEKQAIDDIGCGGGICYEEHEIVDIATYYLVPNFNELLKKAKEIRKLGNKLLKT